MSSNYMCPFIECRKTFASNKNLRDHIRTHTGEKPYKCKECGQGFAQYSTLHKHYRVHDKKRPYSCRFQGCDKSFTQISNRIRHERIHSGEKPFQCAMCPKRFCSSSNLNQHLKIHKNKDFVLDSNRDYILNSPYFGEIQIQNIEDENQFNGHLMMINQQPSPIYITSNDLFAVPLNAFHSVPSVTQTYCVCETSYSCQPSPAVPLSMVPVYSFADKCVFQSASSL